MFPVRRHERMIAGVKGTLLAGTNVRVKLGLCLAVCGVLPAFGGCLVGSGSGSTTGPLFVVSCDKGREPRRGHV
jgi:hypothetical protein